MNFRIVAAIISGVAICLLCYRILGCRDTASSRGQAASAQSAEHAPREALNANPSMPATRDANPPPASPTSGTVSSETAPVVYDEYESLKRMRMSSNLRKAIVPAPGNTLPSRRQALQKLDKNLAEHDVEALTAYVALHFVPEAEQISFADGMAMKNDILQILVKQDSVSPELPRKLAKIIRDTRQEPVVRDYCIQHLAYFLEASPPPPPDIRALVLAVYGEMLSERSTTLAGTALIGLASATREDPSLHQETLEHAVAIAADDTASDAARTTALHIAADGDPQAMLPTARMLAQTGESSLLRLAAIAVLGKSGNATDIELLHSLSGETDVTAQKQIRRAIDTITRRLAIKGGGGK